MCRSRRELSNEYLLAKFGFDIAENEPCKVCPLSAYISPRFFAMALRPCIAARCPALCFQHTSISTCVREGGRTSKFLPKTNVQVDLDSHEEFCATSVVFSGSDLCWAYAKDFRKFRPLFPGTAAKHDECCGGICTSSDTRAAKRSCHSYVQSGKHIFF